MGEETRKVRRVARALSHREAIVKLFPELQVH